MDCSDRNPVISAQDSQLSVSIMTVDPNYDAGVLGNSTQLGQMYDIRETGEAYRFHKRFRLIYGILGLEVRHPLLGGSHYVWQ